MALSQTKACGLPDGYSDGHFNRGNAIMHALQLKPQNPFGTIELVWRQDTSPQHFLMSGRNQALLSIMPVQVLRSVWDRTGRFATHTAKHDMPKWIFLSFINSTWMYKSTQSGNRFHLWQMICKSMATNGHLLSLSLSLSLVLTHIHAQRQK